MPPACQLSRAYRRACVGPFADGRHDDDDRPAPPDPNAIWDGARWVVLSSARALVELERVRPCQGVAPGAARRHDDDKPLPWKLLDARLAGVEQRRGRTGDQWIWAPERSAIKTMHDVRQQTARSETITAHDLREPTWLRDADLGLSARELRLVVALVCAYETGWGGIFDCQSTLAADLQLGCERTLRNLLWGTHWKRRDGTPVRRPGLVERGFVTAIQCYKPGDARARPSDFDWLLLRVGPLIERAAAWTTLAKQWTARAPRGSGWTRSIARAMAARLRSRAGRGRFAAAGAAWEARGHEPTPASSSSTPPENRTPPSSTTPPENRTPPSSTTPPLPSSTTTPEKRSASRSAASRPPQTGPLVDLADVARALARVRGSRPAATRPTREAIEQARAECARMRVEFPELEHLPLERPTTVRPKVNWSASPADNPATKGPPSGAPLDGVGGSGGDDVPPPKGAPLSSTKPLARFPLGPSYADRSGAVRPIADESMAVVPGPGPGLPGLPARSIGEPVTSRERERAAVAAAERRELSRRLAARGGAPADAARSADQVAGRDPELAAMLLAFADAWAGD